MTALPEGRKSFNRFSRFDTIPVCDGQTPSHVTVASTRYAYLRRAVKTVAKECRSAICEFELSAEKT